MNVTSGAIRHTLSLVRFHLGHDDFGVPIGDVREIVLTTELAPPPATPHNLAGLLNLRRRWIPVVDLRARLGLPAVEDREEHRILILAIRGEGLGIAVDGVHEVVHVRRDALGPPPAETAFRNGFLSAAAQHGDRHLLLVDVGRLFRPEEVAALASLARQVHV